VDQDDHVLDIRVQNRRNQKAAKKCFRKLLKGLTSVPRVVITDKLTSDGAAKREILPGVDHRQSRYLNNRCENSHRPTRQRECWHSALTQAKVVRSGRGMVFSLEDMVNVGEHHTT
jgi:putative transposase